MMLSVLQQSFARISVSNFLFIAARYAIGTGLQQGNISDLWTGLAYLLLGVIAINIPTFKRMSQAVERRAKHEAAFKYVHSRIRLHAETIALYAAEDVEISEVNRAFDSVVSSCKHTIAWQSLFQGLQIVFQLLPSAIAGTNASSTLAPPLPRFFLPDLNLGAAPEYFIGTPNCFCFAAIISRNTIFAPGSDFTSATLTVQSATALYSVLQNFPRNSSAHLPQPLSRTIRLQSPADHHSLLFLRRCIERGIGSWRPSRKISQQFVHSCKQARR
jgi:hypothetical protein